MSNYFPHQDGSHNTEFLEEFSLYGIANCRAIVPLECHLATLDLTETEIRHFAKPETQSIGQSEAVVTQSPGMTLVLYWSIRRSEWVAFRVITVPIDMMYDEVNIVHARSLNEFALQKLKEAFNIPKNYESEPPLSTYSPEALRRTATTTRK